MSTDLIQILQQKILKDIPLTKHMGVSVESYNGQELQLKASLKKNINHRQTAFGGSISSLATLAGWGFLYLKFHELNIPARIVIQQGSTEYLKPVTSDFIAICKDESGYNLDKFIATLMRKGVARVELKATVLSDKELVAEFRGAFVAKLPEE